MSMSCYAMSCECGVSVRTCGTVLRRQLPWLSTSNRGCAFNPLKRSAPRGDHPRTLRPRAVTAPLALHQQGFRDLQAVRSMLGTSHRASDAVVLR